MGVEKSDKRILIAGIVLFAGAFGNYLRMAPGVHLRRVEELTLIALGLAAGVVLVSLVRLVRSR